MGFFSWKTNDTKRSICNRHSIKKPFTVYMHDDKGNMWKEHDYDGYGEFGGKDYYELLAEMNGEKPTRDNGIEMNYDPELKGKLIFPNLTEERHWLWRNEEPENCPRQGFFYAEDWLDESDGEEVPGTRTFDEPDRDIRDVIPREHVTINQIETADEVASMIMDERYRGDSWMVQEDPAEPDSTWIVKPELQDEFNDLYDEVETLILSAKVSPTQIDWDTFAKQRDYLVGLRGYLSEYDLIEGVIRLMDGIRENYAPSNKDSLS